MKVGVYFAGSVAEAGGGYTFENEIFTRLLEEAHLSKHDYIIFSGDSNADEIVSRFDLSNVHFAKDPGASLFMQTFRGVYSFIGDRVPLLYKLGCERNGSIYYKHQIDVILYLSPAHPVLDIPYFTIVWDLEHRSQPWFPEVSHMGEWTRREKRYLNTLRRASLIITGTECGKEEITFFYNIPPSRIQVLPFPTPRFALDGSNKGRAEDTIRKYGIQGDYLFYPAQFWAHKNHINLLYGLKMLHDEYGVKLSLVLVGSDKGNMAHIQRVIEELGLSKYVHILGFVSQGEVVDLYRGAFALTFLSLFGPDNLPPLEAFALGCPVIAARTPGAEEQLGDTALRVDPKDPEEIARAVYLLYTDTQLRNQLIQKGLVRATAWKGDDYIRGIFSLLDKFENVRRCWGQP